MSSRMEESAAESRERIELEVRRCCDAGDFDGAARAALAGYEAELYGLLVALLKDEDDASDVFAILSENLWRGLPKFAWGSTVRTWAYAIARNAARRYREQGRRHERGAVPIGDYASELALPPRTATSPFLKTETKDRLTRLRETLPEEDQLLLVLRVDRDLRWAELALVMLGHDDAGPPTEDALKREAARLRKRFQLVKEKLVELGRKQGLLSETADRSPPPSEKK